jgi:hypothetical protein
VPAIGNNAPLVQPNQAFERAEIPFRRIAQLLKKPFLLLAHR